MTNTELSELASCISAHIHRDGAYTTLIPGLQLFRQSAPTVPDQCVQTPALAVIAQGAKRLHVGRQAFSYDSDQYVVVSLDLPMSVTVTKATRIRPYLGLRFDLDLSQFSAMQAPI